MILLIIFLSGAIVSYFKNQEIYFQLISLLAIVLISLPSLSLFVNYYLFAKGKLLIMSAGKDTFYFGDKDSPVKYDKNDIELVKLFNMSESRNPVREFALTVIVFKDGRKIHIPNIFVNETHLLAKLRSCPVKHKNTYEFIPFKATT